MVLLTEQYFPLVAIQRQQLWWFLFLWLYPRMKSQGNIQCQQNVHIVFHVRLREGSLACLLFDLFFPEGKRLRAVLRSCIHPILPPSEPVSRTPLQTLWAVAGDGSQPARMCCPRVPSELHADLLHSHSNARPLFLHKSSLFLIQG